jgi:HEPN domain-containing protein
MNDQADLINLVRQWVQKAENDLKNANHTLTMGEDCPYDTVCFHAQQCVEKYLKALLICLSIDFPKIHDIGELIRLLPPNIRVPLLVSEQEKLTDYATVSRYPGDWEPTTRAEAEEAVAIARKIRHFVRGHLVGRKIVGNE